MLPKKERLSRESFNRSFSMGRRYNSQNIQVIHHKGDTLHVSVVVPKKAEKSAVRRNLLRRRLYDIVRRLRSVEVISGTYIIIVRPTAVSRTYQELKAELTPIITRIAKVR